MYAAYYGFAEICNLLLSEANVLNSYGEFALVNGIKTHNVEVVKVLIEVEGMMVTCDGLSILQIC